MMFAVNCIEHRLFWQWDNGRKRKKLLMQDGGLEVPDIREGENTLTSLWAAIQKRGRRTLEGSGMHPPPRCPLNWTFAWMEAFRMIKRRGEYRHSGYRPLSRQEQTKAITAHVDRRCQTVIDEADYICMAIFTLASWHEEVAVKPIFSLGLLLNTSPITLTAWWDHARFSPFPVVPSCRFPVRQYAHLLLPSYWNKLRAGGCCLNPTSAARATKMRDEGGLETWVSDF